MDPAESYSPGSPWRCGRVCVLEYGNQADHKNLEGLSFSKGRAQGANDWVSGYGEDRANRS